MQDRHTNLEALRNLVDTPIVDCIAADIERSAVLPLPLQHKADRRSRQRAGDQRAVLRRCGCDLQACRATTEPDALPGPQPLCITAQALCARYGGQNSPRLW